MAKICAAGARVQRSASLRTLEDLANCEDALGLALNTEGLIDSVSSSPAPVRSPDPSPATNTNRNLAQTAVNQTFSEWGVDVIMGPARNGIARVAATAGYPVGAVPLRVAELDGGAFGVQVNARPREEGTTMRVMIAWEGTVSLEVGKALDMASQHQRQPSTIETSNDESNIEAQVHRPIKHEHRGRSMHRRERGQSHLTSKEKERIASIAFRMEQNVSNEDNAKIERGTVTLSP